MVQSSLKDTLQMDETSRQQNVMLFDKPQHKSHKPMGIVRFTALLSVLCLTTFYSGYCLAYLAGLDMTNVAVVYGDITNVAEVRAFLLACLPYGTSLAFVFVPLILPLETRRYCIYLKKKSHSYLMLYCIGFCQGILAGFFLALVTQYVKQIMPKQYLKKGVYGIYVPLSLMLGFVVCFSLSTGMNLNGVDQVLRWHIVVAVDFFAILTVIIGIVTKFIPESPNSLIAKGRQQQAKQVIGLFYQAKAVQGIYLEKVKQVQNAKKNPTPPKDRPTFKTILTFQLPIMHQFTGINACFAQMAFAISTYNLRFSDYLNVMMGSVQLLSAVFSVTYLYRYKKNKMILLGNLGMSLSAFGIAIGFLLLDTFSEAYWISVAFVLVLMGVNGATLSTVVWMYIPEVGIKNEIRWAQVVNWFVCASTIVIFVLVSHYFSHQTTFFIYGIVSMLFLVYNVIFTNERQNIQQINKELSKLQIDTSRALTVQNKEQQVKIDALTK